MDVHMRTLPDADRGIPKGGVAPFFGRKLRSGVAAPAAVPQLQDSQAHTEALARTWKWRFGAHAPRCLMCTRRSAAALADPRSKSASREPSRAPCREAVDHRSGSRGSVEVVQLDDPLEAGLQVAIQEFGGMKVDQARRFKELEKENARLKRAVANLTVDKLILEEATKGNF